MNFYVKNNSKVTHTLTLFFKPQKIQVKIVAYLDSLEFIISYLEMPYVSFYHYLIES